jgi:hypothetical protein
MLFDSIEQIGVLILFHLDYHIIERANKITNMDDKAISDLASELEGDVSDDKDEKAKKLQKKKNAIEHRLAAERKRDAKKKKKAKDDDDDDDAGLETFAKGSRVKKN